MNTKKIILLFTLTVLLIACNENQQVVKKLDGDWEVTHYNNEPVSDSNLFIFSKITFNQCKLKNNEYCNGSVTFSDFLNIGFNIAYDVEYNITNEGETLNYKIPKSEIPQELDSLLEIPTKMSLSIVTLEKKELKLQYEGSIIDLEKVD